ncbi:MAG: hypothetical protein WCF65_08010 [Parachlamydiaceae bacterium]
MLKQQSAKRRRKSLPSTKVETQLRLYRFPVVDGFEAISTKLNAHPAENIFGALLHVFELKPIEVYETAIKAERLLEYLDRAFENDMPLQIFHYQHLLFTLTKEYDALYHVRAAKGMSPSDFLKALLIENNISQKSLVPECFPTESQVSEFLHQKKGRNKLGYEQAVILGKKFHVDPLNFL